MEKREGAQGLPNSARENNRLRYRLGRLLYDAEHSGDAEAIAAAKKAHDAVLLAYGDAGNMLGIKGKKVKAAKAAEDGE